MEIIEPCAFPLDDRAVRRAALDYGPLAVVARHESWADFFGAPARAEGRLVLLTTKAAVPLNEISFQSGDTLVMGAESAGAPDFVHAAAALRVRIPLASGARSLNVVTAAAIALGEALRQTGGFAEQAPPLPFTR